jgi:6-pyruvoyltetrahydropterin/6-carboxytetrahydropterin synthase
MLTCSKTYKDIPFAHRQPLHKGHCSKIHGHNWTIVIEFEATELDANGFVVDFGNLKYLKAFIDEHLDHACLFF